MLDVLIAAIIALPYVVAFLLALLVCFLAWATFVSPVAGVALIVATYVLTAMGAAAALQVGLFITLADLSLALIAFVALARWVSGRRPDGSDVMVRAWLVLSVVWFGLFSLGSALYKTLAGVYFRDYFYLWACVSYLLTFRLSASQARDSVQALVVGGLVLCALALYRWSLLALDQPDPFWYEGKGSIRVITAGGAQLLALCFAAGIAGWAGLARRRIGWSVLAVVLVPMLVLLGHRSVWIAVLATALCALCVAQARRSGAAARVLWPLVIGVALVAGAAALLPSADLGARLNASVAEATEEHSTLAWRVDSWRELVTDWVGGGPAVWLFGRPFGSTMRRFIEAGGVETIATAHSHYVSLLVRGGLIGIAAYLLVQVIALRRLLAGASAEGDASDLMLALFVVCCMVYAIPYGTDYMQGIALGLAYNRALALHATANALPTTRSGSRHAHRMRTDVP